ncbi:MAG: glutamate-5-semialdehyde dehydrogenase [Lachnospiraceae bacterium]|nr:glutamate-5-semialdehyde dehydrogenase [Lachnospiraceae bacterium]
MTELELMGERAKEASRIMAVADTSRKNSALLHIAFEIDKRRDEWIAANLEDLKAARESGMRESLIDRLSLNDKRIDGIVESLKEIVALPDPIGETLDGVRRPNGLFIAKRRVPIGVIGIIYEARPNVTVDAAALTLKTGNAVILRGGKEAINSNKAVVNIMREAIASAGIPEDAVMLVTDTSRESATELMHLSKYLDVLIPRGGRNLIRSVVDNASVPVIRTGEGVCHIYVESSADLNLGAKILFNAKCQRPSVCNAAECVIIDEAVLKPFLDAAVPLLDDKHVELRCDEKALEVLGSRGVPATVEDWDTEYGDQILAVKTVKNEDEALRFISDHSTGHSEAIITGNYGAAERFLNEVDAAAVYVNASTRFTDGGEFGLGAEIGISTQKIHARGPMGLKELTSYKYVVYGNGQIRE